MGGYEKDFRQREKGGREMDQSSYKDQRVLSWLFILSIHISWYRARGSGGGKEEERKFTGSKHGGLFTVFCRVCVCSVCVCVFEVCISACNGN